MLSKKQFFERNKINFYRKQYKTDERKYNTEKSLKIKVVERMQVAKYVFTA